MWDDRRGKKVARSVEWMVGKLGGVMVVLLAVVSDD